MASKQCTQCQQTKPLEAFHRNKRTPDGRRSACRNCQNAAARIHYDPAKDHAKYERRKTAVLAQQKTNRTRHRQQARERYWRNPKKARAAAKQYARKLRREVLAHYGGQPPRCVCCGETEPLFLTIDHIEGGGRQHREKLGGAAYFYRWLKHEGWPLGFQVLCWNCNRGQWANDGCCPHQQGGVRDNQA